MSETSVLRRKIRDFIREASAMPDRQFDLSPSSSDEEPPQTSRDSKDSKTLQVSQKPDMTLQSTVVEITKAAAYGMERIELLKKRDFPTHASANAVGNAVDALELIFQDMLRNPMHYLDEDPEETVADYEKYLDDEQTKLG